MAGWHGRTCDLGRMGLRDLLAALLMVALYPFVEYGLHRFILHGRFLYRSRLTAAPRRDRPPGPREEAVS